MQIPKSKSVLMQSSRFSFISLALEMAHTYLSFTHQPLCLAARWKQNSHFMAMVQISVSASSE